VTFDSDGVIELTSTLTITNDTVIDAANHTISLSGRDAVRVLQLGEGTKLELRNLTIHAAGPLKALASTAMGPE
jgi:hypothetical protein